MTILRMVTGGGAPLTQEIFRFERDDHIVFEQKHVATTQWTILCGSLVKMALPVRLSALRRFVDGRSNNMQCGNEEIRPRCLMEAFGNKVRDMLQKEAITSKGPDSTRKRRR